MRKYLLLLPLISIISCSGSESDFVVFNNSDHNAKSNNYPIVLVHGFMGFGREAGFGYRYWGGTLDLQEKLRQHNYPVFTAAVGPFSSNWDRACELFACIKGGRVDYGAAHAELHGHKRFGRTYPGLYPQWGEQDPNSGEINKIHLLSHSMGGQTARLLVQLLEQGIVSEAPSTKGSKSIPPLFSGGKSWVHSVTTLSTPHNGTSLTRFPDVQLIFQHLIGLLAVTEAMVEEAVIDFRWDQWGLVKKPGESALDYQQRILAAPLWDNTRDLCKWDLSPEGAAELNRWVQAQSDVYYFSWATEETTQALFSKHQRPELGINSTLKVFAQFMGSYSDPPMVDKRWWPNDGVVNTNSMPGPTLDSEDQIVPFSGVARRGVWNYMGLFESIDHANIIGIPVPGPDSPGSGSLLNWSLGWAAFLTSLPR